MNLLVLADEPTVGETPAVARCRCCRRLLRTEESLGYVIGPTCRKRLGIAPRQPVRLARTKPGGDCEGQTNLLEEAFPMEVVKPAGPWKVEFYAGERLIEARTMHEELDKVLRWAHMNWGSYRAVLDSEVTVRLSQDDRTFDQEAVAAEYDRRFAFALGSWYMTAQERRAAFEQKYGPMGDDDRPNATVHRIFPQQEGTTP